MSKTDKDIIANKSTILTTNEIYKNIYLNQSKNWRYFFYL